MRYIDFLSKMKTWKPAPEKWSIIDKIMRERRNEKIEDLAFSSWLGWGNNDNWLL